MTVAEPIVFVVDDDPSYRGFLAALAESGGWRAQTSSPARWTWRSRCVRSRPGQSSFWIKHCPNQVLLEAIGQAIEGSKATLGREAEMHALRARHGALSPREREVMALVVSGRLNKQVGSELGISEITVKAHRSKMMRKMNAGSLPELVTMAVVLGLLAEPARPGGRLAATQWLAAAGARH
jgi:FixJ family two-component response regulator